MTDQRTTTQRGYGAAHRRARAAWARHVRTGLVPCARCGQPIEPDTPWHLDHNDSRDGYLGPSHAACNVTNTSRQRTRRPAERHPGLN